MNVKWTALLVMLASLCYGMQLTPISFSLPNQGDLLDEWTLEVDLDQTQATWEIRLHSMALDGRILLPPTTADMIDGWGQTISSTRIMLPLCVTVMVPLGGSTTWRAQGRSSGQLVCQSMGTIQGGPFWPNDDAAAAWCTTGPGVRPWAGCMVFDEDSDGDVDLRDWSLRCRPAPAAPIMRAVDIMDCLRGPGVRYDPECWIFDADSDGDVDMKDWSKR